MRLSHLLVPALLVLPAVSRAAEPAGGGVPPAALENVADVWDLTPIFPSVEAWEAARDIDSVARLAEHRFGILVEGPLTAEEVAAAGPRVVARCLMPFKNKPIEWVAQVRVAQALVPQDGTDPDIIVGQLEALLASVARDDRRAVFPLSREAKLTVPS